MARRVDPVRGRPGEELARVSRGDHGPL